MRTTQAFLIGAGVMLSLLLMIVVFKPYIFVEDEGTSEKMKLVQAAGEDEGTPEEMKLIQAAGDGEIETIKALIESGTDVNAKDKDGYTALMKAAEHGRAEIVNMLLRVGAKVDQKDKDGETALIKVVGEIPLFTEESGMINFIGILTKGGERAEVAQLLLQAGADLHAKDKDGRPAFILAARSGYAEVIKVFLQAGVKVNAKDKDDATMLIWAAHNGHIEAVQVLLQAGAKVDNKDGYGYTALIRAADRGYIEIVQALLQAGADVNAQDTHGVISRSIRWIVNALLTGDDTETTRGDTALIAAARRGHVEIVEIFLQAGAKVNAKDNDGYTALMTAEGWGQDEVVEILKKAGAKE